LGLTTEQSWELTPREFDALKRVYDAHMVRWAQERADFRNAHFKMDHPCEPDEFFAYQKPNPQKVHPAFQRALLDQAMGQLPDWMDKLKGAKKQ
jgi:hypothetical protein